MTAEDMETAAERLARARAEFYCAGAGQDGLAYQRLLEAHNAYLQLENEALRCRARPPAGHETRPGVRR